jgi:hypothetical protein
MLSLAVVMDFVLLAEIYSIAGIAYLVVHDNLRSKTLVENYR